MSGLRSTSALLTGTGLCLLMPIAAEAQTSMQELNDLKAQIEQLTADALKACASELVSMGASKPGNSIAPPGSCSGGRGMVTSVPKHLSHLCAPAPTPSGIGAATRRQRYD